MLLLLIISGRVLHISSCVWEASVLITIDDNTLSIPFWWHRFTQNQQHQNDKGSNGKRCVVIIQGLSCILNEGGRVVPGMASHAKNQGCRFCFFSCLWKAGKEVSPPRYHFLLTLMFTYWCRRIILESSHWNTLLAVSPWDWYWWVPGIYYFLLSSGRF